MPRRIADKLRRALSDPLSSTRRGKRRVARRRPSFETLEARQLLSITPLEDFSVSENTGEKPQSKVWEYAEQWWTVMPENGDTWLWQLEGTTWEQKLAIAPGDNFHADVKVVDNLAHVLLYDGSQSKLATIEYDHGPDNRYEMWSLRPELVDISLSSRVETATLEVDSVGQMWIASDARSTVEVRHSSGLYTDWSQPLIVGTGISSDDISSVVAMPNGSIGVMWSNQKDDRFYFRTHVDGAASIDWSPTEVAASQSATSNMADDHINLAVASDGTLYAAVKTSKSSPRIVMLVRRPSGVWDEWYPVASRGTRPIVVINEVANKLIVAYTKSDSGGNIRYRESPMDNISFGPVETLIHGGLNNPSSVKAPFDDEVVVIAGGGGGVSSVMFRFDTPAGNLRPVVTAGADQTILFGTGATLVGSVTDDGQPASGSLAAHWSVVSAPGLVAFGASNSAQTDVSFGAVGTYVFRLTGDDGQLQASDTVTITVESTTPSNQTPVVAAGTDQSIFLGDGVSLDGTVTDDGLPASPGAVTTTWSQIGGPGIATFADSNTIDTTATFSAAGTYQLRITAHDGELTSSDNIMVTVVDGTLPVTVAFQDGLFPTIDYQGTRDTQLLSSASNTNFGSDANLRIDGKPDISDLLYWDLSAIPTGSVIESVSIELDFNSRTKHSYDVHVMERAWDEMSATWDQAAVGESWATAGAAGTADRDSTSVTQISARKGGKQSYALSAAGIAAVQGWVEDTTTNHGFVIQNFSNTDGIDFNSREATSAAKRPKLVVTYRTSDESDPPDDDPPAVNEAPVVNAGADQSLVLGGSVSLDGTVADDGLPAAPGAVTTTWSQVSGPGTATFANPNAIDTTATFTAAGTYEFRLTAHDGEFTSSDIVTITVVDSTQPVTVAFQDGLFPAIDYQGTRDTQLNSRRAHRNYGNATTLEMDGRPDISDLLYWDLDAIPAGSVIESVAMELNFVSRSRQTYEIYTMERNWDELTATWDQAATGDFWETAGAAGAADRNSTSVGEFSAPSKGLHHIALNQAGINAVQAWVNDSATNRGLIIQDFANPDGADFETREAIVATNRPKLIVTYRPAAGGGAAVASAVQPAMNLAPVVNVGPDLSLVRPNVANLRGTVSDSGQPAASAQLSLLWTASGPGNVTFDDATSASTAAEFSSAGTYVLRLTADHGELASMDELTITVSDPPLSESNVWLA